MHFSFTATDPEHCNYETCCAYILYIFKAIKDVLLFESTESKHLKRLDVS